MSDDVTIPRETAQAYVRQVRAVAARLPLSETGKMLTALADLLDPPDPPQPSLRDEVAEAVVAEMLSVTEDVELSDIGGRILTVVRKRVEALDRVAKIGDHLAYLPDGDLLYRDDVLDLLDGDTNG